MCKEQDHTHTETDREKTPIINCHTHIFTGKHVAPYLGKTLIPAYKLLNLTSIFRLFHWWYTKGPGKWPVLPWYKRMVKRLYDTKMFLARHRLWSFLTTVIGLFLMFQFIDIICHWKFPVTATYNSWWMNKVFIPLHHFLKQVYVLPHFKSNLIKGLLLLILFIFFKSGRNLIIFVLKNTVKWLSKLPGKQTKEAFLRYLTIGRFTFQQDQGSVLGQLENQYPGGTAFVILPMDMEYMDAGNVKQNYPDQMKKLAALKIDANDDGTLKHQIYPFVFVDPRRIEADPDFFKYAIVNGEIVLEDCFIKEYIEEKEFSGFKIYPALGYYPFDALLLPLWKYAAENNIPVLTHCVRGPMFYRGAKKEIWDTHPVFRQAMGNSDYKPLLLSQRKNSEYTANFTHPMNFLCLLEKEFLAEVVDAAYKKENGDKRLKEIFGLTESTPTSKATIKYGLGDLKICLGHYGGGDEWNRYFEKDRYGHSNELSQNPYWGIDFINLKGTNKPSPGKPEQLWKYTDWYSIISSMILQHPNVYADISYILHDDAAILPLLKQTLQNPELRKKVLYGTDFYVVRNHKSDKNMLADMMGGLDVNDFDQIARVNPRKFLNLPPYEPGNKE